MRFKCFARWDELPPSADALFEPAEAGSIFFSRIWLQDVVTPELHEGRSLCLACVIEGDGLLAILPLMRQGDHYFESLAHLYTSLSTLLLGKKAGSAVLQCLALGLKELGVRFLKIDPVAENDAGLQQLETAMAQVGFDCDRRFRFYNWIHQTRGKGFAGYMAERPSRLRHTISRKQRKLAREHGFQFRMCGAGDVEQGLVDYNTVYRASWKANELFEGFVSRLAVTLATKGWLRLGVLYVGKRPVAAQIWFVVNRTASIFKLHYDQHWQQYSPGSILTSLFMEHVIDNDKVEVIDFLNGNDRYKQDWMSTRQIRWSLFCVISTESQKSTPGSLESMARRLLRVRTTLAKLLSRDT